MMRTVQNVGSIPRLPRTVQDFEFLLRLHGVGSRPNATIYPTPPTPRAAESFVLNVDPSRKHPGPLQSGVAGILCPPQLGHAVEMSHKTQEEL